MRLVLLLRLPMSVHPESIFPYNGSHPIRKGGTKFVSDFSYHDQWRHLGSGRHSGQPQLLARVIMEDVDSPLTSSLQVEVESAIANTFCCTWVNPSGQGGRSMLKSKEKATWLSEVEIPGGWWNLFSRLDPGPWGIWLRSVLQFGFILQLEVLFTVGLIKCCMSQTRWNWLVSVSQMNQINNEFF